MYRNGINICNLLQKRGERPNKAWLHTASTFTFPHEGAQKIIMVDLHISQMKEEQANEEIDLYQQYTNVITYISRNTVNALISHHTNEKNTINITPPIMSFTGMHHGGQKGYRRLYDRHGTDNTTRQKYFFSLSVIKISSFRCRYISRIGTTSASLITGEHEMAQI